MGVVIFFGDGTDFLLSYGSYRHLAQVAAAKAEREDDRRVLADASLNAGLDLGKLPRDQARRVARLLHEAAADRIAAWEADGSDSSLDGAKYFSELHKLLQERFVLPGATAVGDPAVKDSLSAACPACSYGGLYEPPWSADGSPSDEICPCCGIQFGYDDAAGGNTAGRQQVYQRWREEWISRGRPWFSSVRRPPPGSHP
jgi:hypothetical protein